MLISWTFLMSPAPVHGFRCFILFSKQFKYICLSQWAARIALIYDVRYWPFWCSTSALDVCDGSAVSNLGWNVGDREVLHGFTKILQEDFGL